MGDQVPHVPADATFRLRVGGNRDGLRVGQVADQAQHLVDLRICRGLEVTEGNVLGQVGDSALATVDGGEVDHRRQSPW